MEVNLTKEDHRVAVSVTKNSTEEQLLGAVQRAETASDECAILYDLFDDRFLGAKESAPTLDNDGDAIQVGAMYYNYVTLTTHVWNGSGWDTTGLSANDIKVAYESNADTNVFTDAEKAYTASPSNIKFDPQVSSPTYIEGNVFYNDPIGTLDVQGKYSDVTLQVGREMHMEVLNNTIAVITNGSACTQSGVSSNIATVKLAIADTFNNARMLGIATHDIGIGERGILTTFGEVNGLNTLGVTTGVPLYLSDTVAGTFVETPPNIISRIGGVFVADETNGKLFVFIINNKNLPSVVGGMQGMTVGNETYSLTTTAQDIINYDTIKEIVVTVDPLTGLVTVPNDGEYRVHFTASISFVSSTSTRSITLELYDVTNTLIAYSYPKNIPRDATEDGLSFSWAKDRVAGDVSKMRIKSSVAMDITFDDISFDLESVNIH